MRYAELAFLVLLTLYHAFLLVPRHRRAFAANYLVFLAGMALVWNLAAEGLRWQTLPPTVLLLLDLLILFPTFKRLRGQIPLPGFWTGVAGFGRSLVASVAFLTAVGCVGLAVAFPLPTVELTGGITPGYRVVRFPPTLAEPGLELRMWYPASGDSRTQPRPTSDPVVWQNLRTSGGPPVFWSSHLEHLPSSLIRGGKLSSPKTRYPVIYVALPRGQDPGDFGYLWEDLASRGFLVVASLELPEAPKPAPAFSWAAAWADVLQPFSQPTLWVEPDFTWGKAASPADYRWLAPGQQALRQLDSEPGDLLFSSVDWNRQGLWVWGYGTPLDPEAQRTLGLRGVLHAGGRPPAGHVNAGPELWILAGTPPAARSGQWFLSLPRLERADLSDAAYLKPTLFFVGLKTQADAGNHGALRQYQAAFFQYVFWGLGGDATFGQTVPQVPGVLLTGK